jgi:pimeloyl-ACP methyl ester carboxylesterase
MSDVKWILRHLDLGSARLHGIETWPDQPRGLLIHLHGTWGNFYANSLVEEVAKAALSEGWGFASVNLPGHDETAMDESLEDSSTAVTQWIELLNPRGLPVVIQGHSLGALKAINFASNSPRIHALRVKSLFLLSAFDCVGFYLRETKISDKDFSAMPPGEIVPESVFGYWLLRWAMLDRLTTVDGEWDLFRSRLLNPDELLGSIRLTIPAFFAIGSLDFAAVPSSSEVAATVRENRAFTEAVVIPDASHSFAGKETTLAANIARWLRTVSVED